MMQEKFIIITSPRSGSTVFCQWLNSHPEVRCHAEIFLRGNDAQDAIKAYAHEKKRVPGWLFDYVYNRLVNNLPFNFFRKNLVNQYYESFFMNPEHCAPWSSPDQWGTFLPQFNHKNEWCVGFKIMNSNLSHLAELRRKVLDDSFNVIFLQRENLIAQYISYARSKKTGQTTVCDGQVERPKIRVNVSELLAEAQRQEKWLVRYEMEFSQLAMFKCSYERFLNDREVLAGDLIDFLGVSSANLEMPGMKRISTGQVQDDVDNWDEVVNRLQGSKYEHLLEFCR